MPLQYILTHRARRDGGGGLGTTRDASRIATTNTNVPRSIFLRGTHWILLQLQKPTAINLLDPELFFLVLAHPVYKMRIIQEPNTIELWNKMHFEEEKNEEYTPYLKYSVPIFVE